MCWSCHTSNYLWPLSIQDVKSLDLGLVLVMAYIKQPMFFGYINLTLTVPKTNISFTDKHMIIPLPKTLNLLYTHFSDWFNLKPLLKITLSNYLILLFRCLFQPIQRLNQHAYFMLIYRNKKPSGCFMYISSYKLPSRNRVLTSTWWVTILSISPKAINNLIVETQATGV